MSETKRIYNLVVKKENPAKLKYRTFYNSKKTPKLPTIVDLTNLMPPIYDQGQLGSCTANALCAVVCYTDPSLKQCGASRLFVYYNERVIEHSVSQDAGATLSDGILSLQKYGVCPEPSWPYKIKKFTLKPNPQCYTQALQNKAIQVQNINNNLDEMRSALVAGYPFVVGILVYSSFETSKVASTGTVPMPNTNTEQLLGGHAVVAVGYDDTKQVFIMRNSWGTSWGNKGYFTLPYAYLLDNNLTSDLWCIQKMT
jgi:C1A family cysteine protease